MRHERSGWMQQLQILLLVCSWSNVHAFYYTSTHISTPLNVLTTQPVKPGRSRRGFASSSQPPRHRHTSHPLVSYRPSSSLLPPLTAFLPPSGGGGKSSELKEIASTVVTLALVVAFFLSPLGAIVFTLFNSLVALLILIPLGGVVAFNVWQYFNTQTAVCPSCQSPVKVMKDESPSVCFSCGSIVQLRDGQIYLANLNNNDVLNLDGPASDDSLFASLFRDTRAPSLDEQTTEKKKRSNTIIDVDAKRED